MADMFNARILLGLVTIFHDEKSFLPLLKMLKYSTLNNNQ